MSAHPQSSASLAAGAAACLAVGLAAAPAARANDVDLLQTSGYVSLGTFLNGSSLRIRLDGEAGETGTDVDWGDSFGDDDVSRFRLDGLWRFADRHHLRFLYTDYSRSETATFDEDIEWGGEIIPVDAEVRAKLGFEIIELAYEYAFLKRENYELAAGIGLHYTTFDASLRASVEGPNGGGTEERGGTASVDAPLPVIGLHGLLNIGKNVYLDAHAQFFALSIDDLDGDIINYRVALLWQPKKYFGLGVGYDYFEIDVDSEKNSFTGSMEWEYSGPQVFVNFAF
jgi:hypothetical protein